MLRAGHGLFLIVATLLVLGVVMVTSAGLTIDPDQSLTTGGILLGRHAGLALLALAAMVLGSRLPLHRLLDGEGVRSPVLWIVAGCLVLLLLVQVPGIGREINGARRWMRIGPLGFQPSEVAKWGLIIFLAWYGARHAPRMSTCRHGLLIPIGVVGAGCALIATQDLGTAVLIGTVACCMLLAAGTRLLHAAMLGPVGAAGFALALLYRPSRLQRLESFMDPFQDAQGTGYQVIQSMTAVSGGGVFGRGLGNSVQKFGYLPEDTTDFLFAIICEELGIVGAFVVLGLFAVLLWVVASIALSARHRAHRLLGLGVLLCIGLQALLNVAVVTGLAPTKGIALPLVSSGGTGWVLTAFMLGLLWSTDRGQGRHPHPRRSTADLPSPST